MVLVDWPLMLDFTMKNRDVMGFHGISLGCNGDFMEFDGILL